jgi:two-component system chemotaxis sensor kinase CheA
MSQFLETFYEESFEGLDIMEKELLNLNIGEADSETINTIFRAAHSIKGGSGTFGLNIVAQFTHVMETLLDEMRDRKRDITQEGIDILLMSVDVLREMLTALRDNTELDGERINESKARLDALLNVSAKKMKIDSGSEAKHDDTSPVLGWTILFRPHPNLLQTGNDPVRMFRELDNMGELDVEVDIEKIPGINALVPDESFFAWTLTLKGNIDKSAITEIFEWVEDDCDLTITAIESKVDPVVVKEEQQTNNTKANSTSPSGERKAKPSTETNSIRVSINKIDDLINMMGELVITQSMLSQLGEADEFSSSHIEKLRDGLAQLERNTREMQENVMRIRMLPISFAFQRFPRLVHDLSGKMNKKIELIMAGEHTELDKTVMEKIGDPLVHLVRNSIDHGIESPEDRLAAGKPETGSINLNAFHEGGKIVIEIKDDGAGLNSEKIRDKAIKSGLVNAEDTLSEEQINDLIFNPGFSTADVVSDVSGRGVGMDVVRKNIRMLGGTVEVKTEAGKGSTFTIRLPLTLAILDGQSVRVGDDIYIIPLISIVESIQINTAQINVVAGRSEVYRLRDEYIPVVKLHEIFNVESTSMTLSEGLLVVVEGDGIKVALFVDDLLGQQQVVIKSLETNFKKVEGVSGATILGDGTVALILDIVGLVHLSKSSDLYKAVDGNNQAA